MGPERAGSFCCAGQCPAKVHLLRSLELLVDPLGLTYECDMTLLLVGPTEGSRCGIPIDCGLILELEQFQQSRMTEPRQSTRFVEGDCRHGLRLPRGKPARGSKLLVTAWTHGRVRSGVGRAALGSGQAGGCGCGRDRVRWRPEQIPAGAFKV